MRGIMVGICIGAVLVGGGAAAAGGRDDGTITACYQKPGGALRIIDASTAKCKSNETQIQWSRGGGSGPNGYEQVTARGTAAGPDFASGDIIGTMQTATCPKGKFPYGGFGYGTVVNGRSVEPADVVETQLTGVGIDDGAPWNSVSLTFRRGDGTVFRPTDRLEWFIQATCALP
jgi:hypothetical protein